MSLIFLTSTGLSNDNVRQEFAACVGPDKTRRVAIITTAADGKERNTYAQLAKDQFGELGFSSVDFFDVESDPAGMLARYPIIYVCGGNTFYLLHHVKRSGADKVLAHLLSNTDLVYVGVSAGSILLAPTIRIAAEVDPDPNDIGLTDFAGLGTVPFEIYPHYLPGDEPALRDYEKKYAPKLERISNEQALIVHNGTIRRIA